MAIESGPKLQLQILDRVSAAERQVEALETQIAVLNEAFKIMQGMLKTLVEADSTALHDRGRLK